jgi:hypothetical protein
MNRYPTSWNPPAMTLHHRSINSTFTTAKMTIEDGESTVKTLSSVHLLR